MASTILVFGRSGQVARELAGLGAPRGLELRVLGRDQLDLLGADPDEAIAARGVGAVINASAYTAVDRAESEPEAALRLNRDVPGLMAEACARRNLPFVHFSTDYVFDGTKPAPYVEDDPVAPASVYGRSKAEGEARVAAAGGRSAVLRTSWVYSAHGSNFVKTMLRLATERDELGVVADQIGRPTWARDCAATALRVAEALLEGEAGATGLLHVAGAGDATWADFAEAAFTESAARGGPAARVRRIATADYPTPARRPANSRLDCGRIEARLGCTMRPWREGVAAVMADLV